MIHAVVGDTKKAVTLRGVDLSTATGVVYRFHQRPGTGTATGSCQILNTTDVAFNVPAAGRYDAEFDITYTDLSDETVPNGSPDVLIVRERVA